MLPRRTRSLMVAAEMPLWERGLLQLAFAAAMMVCFAWTLLVVAVCWPFAVVWWLRRGEGNTKPGR